MVERKRKKRAKLTISPFLPHCRTPSSLDIVYGSFDKLFGRVTDNKNDVVKQGSWYFTGNRNERYKFKGQGARGL